MLYDKIFVTGPVKSIIRTLTGVFEQDSSKVASAYGENFSRLKEIKRKYDPDNFLRMNNNILPG
ncbi:MAG: BBE domain-containing protein [Ginsengibacter sp.]